MLIIANFFYRTLCDICQSGKLNKEQFALAMWLIKHKLQGVEPPNTLPLEMVPPSLRKPMESIMVSLSFIEFYNKNIYFCLVLIAVILYKFEKMIPFKFIIQCCFL